MKRSEKQIINTFKAFSLLSRGSTMKDLAVRLDVSLKSAYRYLELLENVGFLFERSDSHIYKLIQSNSKSHLTISFTKQEMDVVLETLPPDNPYYKSIQDKLYIHSDILSLPHKVLAADFGRNIRLLESAIKTKKRVFLRKYSSANSNQKEDYRIEPIQLDDNYQRLYAYDLEDKAIRQFKTERIEDVEVTEQDQWFTDGYTDKIQSDCFGWMLEDKTWDIQLEMSRGVYHMIKEENPGIAKDSTEQENNLFLLSSTVADLRPVTSLVLRFPGKVRVISPKELEEAAAKRIQKLDFFEKYFMPLSYIDNGRG